MIHKGSNYALKELKTPLYNANLAGTYRVPTSTPYEQEDLADFLNIGERTLRRYKNGEEILTDVQELKRIADLLDVEPERLGAASSCFIPQTLEQIDNALNHVWELVGESSEL